MSDGDPRRLLPRTDLVLDDPRLADAANRLGRGRVRAAVAAELDRLRAARTAPDAAAVADAVLASLEQEPGPLRRVLNATGVVLHTNLGRAPMSAPAVRALAEAAGYVDIEYDLITGRRARRGRSAMAALARALPDAKAVHVTNNGAAALALCAATLGAGREIVVSRGELVEIGDGFRLPELLVAVGARLREVGATNRVTLDDYRAAISESTGFVLKVHPSNFRIEGFTSSVEIADLARLGVPVVADVGSGLIAPDPALPAEPDVRSALRAGAALVTCSGDKLLGGPQCGVIAGRADLLERIRRHPLARAVRVDKLTLAALEATLGSETPTAAALHADPAELRTRCLRAAERLREFGAEVVVSKGAVGGGGAPGVELEGWAVALPASFADPLRRGDPPVVGRIERGRCLLDLRCIAPADDDQLVTAVRNAATTDGG
jgi:L-seryl-tRNA(Ser) seleniumtransferase